MARLLLGACTVSSERTSRRSSLSRRRANRLTTMPMPCPCANAAIAPSPARAIAAAVARARVRRAARRRRPTPISSPPRPPSTAATARKLDALAPALAGHVLAPYVAYWQLKLRHRRRADPAPSARSSTAIANTPLADRLRVDWLKSLGRSAATGRASRSTIRRRRRGRRARVLRHPVPARSATATRRWPPRSRSGSPARPRPTPASRCSRALIARGELTVADRRARFRLAVEAGNVRLAQAIAADLPGNGPHRRPRLRRVDRDPLRALAQGRVRAGTTAAGRELALYALERAARSDAGRRARRVGQVARPRCPRRIASYGNARLAYHAARQLHARGQRLVPRSRRRAADAGRAGVARARGAARAGVARRARRDRRDARARSSRKPAWRYWRARALAATGGTAEASALFAALAGERNFYGLLAAEALGRGARRCRRAIRCADRAGSARGVRRAAGRAARRQARRARHAAGVAARMALRRARPRRRRAAARRRLRAPRRPLRPRDQHRRAHARRATTTRCAT